MYDISILINNLVRYYPDALREYVPKAIQLITPFIKDPSDLITLSLRKSKVNPLQSSIDRATWILSSNPNLIIHSPIHLSDNS